MADDTAAVEPVEQPAVTGRPADIAPENSTFASRAGSTAKAVESDTTENKTVRSSRKK